MNTFKERLAFLWPNEKQAKIAADIDMTLAGFSRIWHEGGLPKAETLKKIKQIKGCNLDWLLTGEGQPFPDAATAAAPALYDTLDNPLDADDYVFIPRYDIEAAAGHGRLAGDERPVHAVPFRRDWVAGLGSVRDLAVIAVKGDSMEGVLNDGDTILIALTEHIRRDGLYVLRIHDNLLVKRLQLMPGGLINVISANEAYASFEINPAAMQDEMAIIGKVVWFGRHV